MVNGGNRRRLHVLHITPVVAQASNESITSACDPRIQHFNPVFLHMHTPPRVVVEDGIAFEGYFDTRCRSWHARPPTSRVNHHRQCAPIGDMCRLMERTSVWPPTILACVLGAERGREWMVPWKPTSTGVGRWASWWGLTPFPRCRCPLHSGIHRHLDVRDGHPLCTCTRACDGVYSHCAADRKHTGKRSSIGSLNTVCLSLQHHHGSHTQPKSDAAIHQCNRVAHRWHLCIVADVPNTSTFNGIAYIHIHKPRRCRMPTPTAAPPFHRCTPPTSHLVQSGGERPAPHPRIDRDMAQPSDRDVRRGLSEMHALPKARCLAAW